MSKERKPHKCKDKRHLKKISFQSDQEEGINVITSETSVVKSSKQEHKCSSASRHSKPGSPSVKSSGSSDPISSSKTSHQTSNQSDQSSDQTDQSSDRGDQSSDPTDQSSDQKDKKNHHHRHHCSYHKEKRELERSLSTSSSPAPRESHSKTRLKDCTPTKDPKSEIMMKKKSPRSSSKARAETNSRSPLRQPDLYVNKTGLTEDKSASVGSTHESGSCYPQSSTVSSHRSCSSAPTTTSSSHRCGSITHPGPVNSQYKERGDALVQEAEQNLSKSLFRSGNERAALECYQRATAQYKMAGDWAKAANIMEIMAKIIKNQGDLFGAAKLHGEAGTCYRKISAPMAVEAYLRSAELYVELGKYGIPAKHHESIALIYSKDVYPPDYKAVIHHLSMAANFYASDNRTAARNKCRIEMARLFALTDRFEDAVTIYEDLGFQSLESRLLKYSADEYLFRAALCHLAVDSLNCTIATKRYIDYYPAFQLSREFKFIQMLCEEVEQESEEGVDNCIRKYKSLCSSDPWFPAILGKIKMNVPGVYSSLR